MQKTKKSLVASGLALVVCLAMLIGTTFAWFTDSVTNKGNHIQAGTLDVTFQQLNTETNEYEDITGPVFNYDKWEPGYTYVSAFKIGNNGSLALKYQLDFVPQGEVSKLAEVIDVYYTASNDAITELPDSVENMTKVGTLADVLAQEDGAAHGHLSAGQADYAAVALHMQETAGNEYQGLSIGTEFDIVLKATQYTEETDGFGSDQYDAGAAYAVATQEEFENALANAEDGDTITMASDLVINTPVVVDKDLTLEGNDGAGFVTSVENKFAIEVKEGANLTVKGCSFTGSTSASSASERPLGIAVRPGAGGVTVENCTFTGAAAKLGHSIWIDGGNTGDVTIRGCTIARPINLSGYNATVSNVTIENNTFTNTFGVQAVTLSGALNNVAIRSNTIGWGGLARIHADGVQNFNFQNVILEDNTRDNITVDAGVKEQYEAALASGGIVIK